MTEPRKWTRKCPWYKLAIANTAIRLGLPEDIIERTVLIYLHKCKQLILQGERVTLPGIIQIGTYHLQLKQLRKFTRTYADTKKRYGKTEYFKKHIAKKKK